MEERREMNGQRMMTREELEMRLPALNHIAEQRDAKLLGTEKIAFFALSNCELMALVAEERITHALKSGLFDAARESVPVEEYFPKSIYGLVSNKSGYCLHRF